MEADNHLDVLPASRRPDRHWYICFCSRFL